MIVIVNNKLVFGEFDPFDPLLHVSRKEITLQHFECGRGEVQILPPAYKRSFLAGWHPNDRAERDGVRLVCARCQTATEQYSLSRIGRSLRLYLVGADPETAPAQAIGENDRFAPSEWPPNRRHAADRRDDEGRHRTDRTMEGRRRLGQERRTDPDSVDETS